MATPWQDGLHQRHGDGEGTVDPFIHNLNGQLAP
jgi:hypothetical protein